MTSAWNRWAAMGRGGRDRQRCGKYMGFLISGDTLAVADTLDQPRTLGVVPSYHGGRFYSLPSS